MKAAGCSSPRRGVAPAQQRLGAGDAAVAQVDEGLIGEVHLAVGEGVGEVELEPAAVELERAFRRLVQHEAAAPLDLGAAERGVGLHQEGGGGAGGAGGHDADRRPHDDAAAVEDEGLADRLQEPAGEGAEAGGAARGDDDEAVALEADQPVAGVERLLEPGAGDGEERVAGGDAQRLVDRVEAVEVEHHQPGGAAGGAGAHRRLHQPLRGGARADGGVERRPRRGGGERAPGAGEERRRQEGGVGEAERERGGEAAGAGRGDEEEARGGAGEGDGGGEGGGEAEGARVDPPRVRGRELRRRRVARRVGQERGEGGVAGDEAAGAAVGGVEADGRRARGRHEPEQRGGGSLVR